MAARRRSNVEKTATTLTVSRPHLHRLALEQLPTIYERPFGVLPVECLIIIHFELVREHVSLEAHRVAHVVIIGQSFAWAASLNRSTRRRYISSLAKRSRNFGKSMKRQITVSNGGSTQAGWGVMGITSCEVCQVFCFLSGWWNSFLM